MKPRLASPAARSTVKTDLQPIKRVTASSRGPRSDRFVLPDLQRLSTSPTCSDSITCLQVMRRRLKPPPKPDQFRTFIAVSSEHVTPSSGSSRWAAYIQLFAHSIAFVKFHPHSALDPISAGFARAVTCSCADPGVPGPFLIPPSGVTPVPRNQRFGVAEHPLRQDFHLQKHRPSVAFLSPLSLVGGTKL